MIPCGAAKKTPVTDTQLWTQCLGHTRHLGTQYLKASHYNAWRGPEA